MANVDIPKIVAKDSRLAKAGVQHGTVIRLRIKVGIETAAAFAFRSLTLTIQNATEGRPTVAAVRKSRSFQAALSRLDEMHTNLIDLVEAARVEFYQIAYRGWHEALPPDVRRQPDPNPPKGLIDRFRAILIAGIKLADDLWFPIRRAQEELERTLVIASTHGTPERTAEDYVNVWAESARKSILQTAQGALEDSLHRADYVAGRDCLKSEMLHPDPSLNE